MPAFQIMREAQHVGLTNNDWSPSVIWGYDPVGRQIALLAVPPHAAIAADYGRRLAWAVEQGFAAPETWQYWVEDGGDGYFTIRSQPKVVEGPTLGDVLQAELARITASQQFGDTN